MSSEGGFAIGSFRNFSVIEDEKKKPCCPIFKLAITAVGGWAIWEYILKK